MLLEIDQQRRKTAVEAHHQQLLSGVGCFDDAELFGGEAKGFLYENMFASDQGLLHQQPVAVMTGSNNDGVAAGVAYEGRHICGSLSETELAAKVYWADTTSCDKSMEGGPGFSERRYESSAGVVARTNHPQQGMPGG